MNTFHRRTLTGTTLLVIALLFIASVTLVSVLFRSARVDLTTNRLYTLSDGTRSLVGKLEEPVQLTFYYSDQASQNIPQLRTYASRVRELLEEIAALSSGRIKLDVIDPLPFSEEEDRATEFGVQPVPLGAGKGSLFFGLAGSNTTDERMSIPFFQPDKEAFLEYDVAKLISGLSGVAKPVVGVLSSIEVGPGFDAATQRVAEGTVVYTELGKLFTVKKLESSVSKIEADIQVLLLIHPKNLSDDTLYAVDQFVLRGGRLVVFVDPQAEAEQTPPGMDQNQAMFQEKSSDLSKLFPTWGVKYDAKQVVLDGQAALEIQARPDQPPVRHLAILGVDGSMMNQADVVTAELESANLSTAGHLQLVEGATTKLEPLIQSSGASALIGADRVRFLPDPKQLFDGFTPTGERYVLAARLSGKLKTAFPDRKDEGHLAESKTDANIVLFADSDLLFDRMWVQVQNFFGQKVMNAFANNGDLIINTVDNLSGSADLISVRTREHSSRPFTLVENLKRTAEDRFRNKEQELQSQLDETENKLRELQSSREDKSSKVAAMMLSPEQEAELNRFRSEKLRIRKELRQVRRQLDADIEALGGRLKFFNIAGVPILLTFAAVGFALLRARRRREART